MKALDGVGLARAVCTLLVSAMLATAACAAEVVVASAAELRAALENARPGTDIKVAPGAYRGGFRAVNLRGEPGRPITISAADVSQPPVFTEGNNGLHLVNPAEIQVIGLVFTRLAQNGLNIDDGGNTAEPGTTRNIVLRDLRISDIGADGNNDGIKLSGVRDFQIVGCTIERWGTKGGSAIDMVGCHRGSIVKNLVRHNNPEPGNCTGVQSKGGSSEILIAGNRFEHAGGRAVNIGGSTGAPFFRPPLVGGQPAVEAKAITVEGNTFVGGVAPVAFVGVDGAVVRFNTIERPARWALRILQENRGADFVACRNGEFTDNVIVFDSTRWSEGGVNIGAGTAPESFRFARNWWYCADQPDRSRPRLPAEEADGVYGQPPESAHGKAGASAWPGR